MVPIGGGDMVVVLMVVAGGDKNDDNGLGISFLYEWSSVLVL